MTRTVVAIMAIVTAMPASAMAQAGSFAGGFAQGLAQGAAIRERRAAAAAEAQAAGVQAETAKRLKLCNAALEKYLDGKGPAPPTMCNGPSPAINIAEAPVSMAPVTSPAALPAPQAPTFTNCTSDTVGGTHCVTH